MHNSLQLNVVLISTTNKNCFSQSIKKKKTWPTHRNITYSVIINNNKPFSQAFLKKILAGILMGRIKALN